MSEPTNEEVGEKRKPTNETESEPEPKKKRHSEVTLLVEYTPQDLEAFVTNSENLKKYSNFVIDLLKNEDPKGSFPQRCYAFQTKLTLLYDKLNKKHFKNPPIPLDSGGIYIFESLENDQNDPFEAFLKERYPEVAQGILKYNEIKKLL